jgi:hypothetical protein
MVREHDACVIATEIRADGNDCVVRFHWDTGNRVNGIDPGDRVYLLQQGDEYPRGIVRVGTIVGPVEPVNQDRWKNQVLVEWGDAVSQDDPLPVSDLADSDLRTWEHNPVNWSEVRQGGMMFDAMSEAKLDRLWSRHIQQYLRNTEVVG